MKLVVIHSAGSLYAQFHTKLSLDGNTAVLTISWTPKNHSLYRIVAYLT